jgi:hypothetical protein
MAAWFIAMGVHEGGHAWAAWWLGDDTAYRNWASARSIPFKHVDWNQPMRMVQQRGDCRC